MSFSREKRVALLAGDLGVLTVSVPLFQTASARSESLWKQTVEMREGNGQRVRETRHREKKKGEIDKRNRWVTMGETRGRARIYTRIKHSFPVQFSNSLVTQWAGELVQTLNRRCPAPGGLDGTWRLSPCHRVHITGLAARDTAAPRRRGPNDGAVCRRWATGTFHHRRARDDTHRENCWRFNLRSQMFEALGPW